MKIYSVSVAVKKSNDHRWKDWQESKGEVASNDGENVGNRYSYVICYSFGENNLVISIKIKNTHTVWPSNSTSGNLSYRKKKKKKDQYIKR